MSLIVTRVLHAGTLFECGETRLLFDPLFETPFSVNCFPFPDVRFDLEALGRQSFDAVFISHYHDDHCSFASLNLLDRKTPLFLYCIYDELFDLLRRLGFLNVQSLNLNETVRVGLIEVIPRLALDPDVDCLFQVRADGVNVLNVVDSWIDPSTIERLRDFAPWDLILWPFQTMRELAVLSPARAAVASKEIPHEWIEQLRLLQPRFVVPSACQFQFEKWSWLNHAFFPISYGQFEKEIAAKVEGSSLLRLNPGESLRLSQTSCERGEPLTWITPIGEQNVDYEYRPTSTVPTTSEIAKLLKPSSEIEKNWIREFCGQTLQKRYAELPVDEGGYFSTPRIWRLTIYEQDGLGVAYQFRLHRNQLAPCAPSEIPQWTTEIPGVKLIGAWSRGEALTSLYVRINDTCFSPDVEKQLDEVDLLEDPLLRCLYNGLFASYQAAQLKRLEETSPIL